MLGEWARCGIRFFTLWLNTDVTTDYIFSSCYKVMGVASNDEIIADAASLKTGVARKIVSTTPLTAVQIQSELKTRLMEQALNLKVDEGSDDLTPRLVLPKMRFET